MPVKPNIAIGEIKPLRRHTTATLRRPIIPKVDAMVALYRKNTGVPVTRTDVVNAILSDVYTDFVSAGLIAPVDTTNNKEQPND